MTCSSLAADSPAFTARSACCAGSAAPGAPLPEVFETLIRTGASKAVVVDADSRLLGMLTLYDLLTCDVPAA